jgi:leucyl-tRNA synthetase
LGHTTSIEFEKFPEFEEKYLIEDEFHYPVSFNGKMKFKLVLPANLTASQIEEIALKEERVIDQLAGNNPKKIIIVPKKIINIVF